MTVFVCDNGHRFSHTAKHIETTEAAFGAKTFPSESFETPVCPICHSKVFSEEVEVQPEHVYIYDLTSGPQTELDGLLAQGYKVVARYSKSYILEKSKEETKNVETV